MRGAVCTLGEAVARRRGKEGLPNPKRAPKNETHRVVTQRVLAWNVVHASRGKATVQLKRDAVPALETFAGSILPIEYGMRRREKSRRASAV